MFDPTTVRFRGPLAPHVDGFWQDLVRLGYAPFSGRNLLLVAAHFSRWLDDRSIACADITDACGALFMAHRRRRGYTQFLTPRALGPLLGYLRRIGVVATPAPTVTARAPSPARTTTPARSTSATRTSRRRIGDLLQT